MVVQKRGAVKQLMNFLLQNVGMNLRDLLSKVDTVIQDLPVQTHSEVS